MANKLIRLFITLMSRGLMLTVFMPLACYVKVWTAKKLGDRTAEAEGRLSLDFRKHTDWFGMLVIMVFGFGWSKEVNIDVSRLKKMKRDVTLISLASPLTYIIMYVILFNIFGAVSKSASELLVIRYVCLLFYKTAFSCLFFAIVALLPLPPLDGFHIFYQFSWPKFRRWYFSNYQKINEWSRYILIAIFFMSSITDGEFSLLGLLMMIWVRILDPLIIF